METGTPRVSVVMRSYNDIDTISQTLDALRRQTFQDFELWNHDSSSCDGSLELIMAQNDHDRILVNDPKDYVPGKILNKAVTLCRGEIIVFINSDATPETNDWLEKLIAPLEDEQVGAVFGRQTARPDCRTLFRKDTERAFGDGRTASAWTHFFSMANAAARRNVLEAFPFNTDIQYSEDIEWSLRLKKAGLRIEYVADASACHSHNYTLKQSWQRHYGEGKAEATIFTDREMNFGFLRYVAAPLAAEITRDCLWSLRHLSLDGLAHTIPLRISQKLGRWQGMRTEMAS